MWQAIYSFKTKKRVVNTISRNQEHTALYLKHNFFYLLLTLFLAGCNPFGTGSQIFFKSSLNIMSGQVIPFTNSFSTSQKELSSTSFQNNQVQIYEADHVNSAVGIKCVCTDGRICSG